MKTLKDLYHFEEAKDCFILREKYQSEVKDEKGNGTGEFVEKLRNPHYYSTSPIGRVQMYNRILNMEISKEEKQSVEKMLEITERVSGEIMEFFKQ